MTFSNVVFYLERLQNKEPITTHVITIPKSVPSNANQPSSESDQFVSTEDYRRYSTRNKKPPDRLDYDYLGG